MKAPVTWLREFVELPTAATVEEIASRIAGAGFEVASIDGDVIDFEVTANRPDCLSIRGLARETATAYQAHLGGRVFRPGVSAGPEGPASVRRSYERNIRRAVAAPSRPRASTGPKCPSRAWAASSIGQLI